MFRLYRTIKLQNRLLALLLITGLAVAIAFGFGYNILWVGLGVTGILILVDLILRRSNFVLAFAIFAIQATLAGLLSIKTGVALAYFVPVADARLYYYTIQFIMVLFLLINLLISIYLVRGRVWLNLLFLSILTDIGFLGFFTYTQNPFLGGLAGIGLIIVYTTLRFMYWRKPKLVTTLHYPNNLKNRVREVFSNQGFEVRETPDANSLKFVALTPERNRVYAIAAIPAETAVRVAGNKLLLNTTDGTDLLEGLLRDITRWRRAYHIPARFVLPVLYTARTIGGETIAKQVVVHKRSKPDLAYGTVYLLNQAGMGRLTRAVAKLGGLRGRNRKRISRLFGDKTIKQQ